MIGHHPKIETLLAYAGGTLHENLAVPLATHLEMCAVCRAQVHACESIGGALLDMLPATQLGVDALTRTLDRLNDTYAESPLNPSDFQGLPLPLVLRHYKIGRRKFVAPGIWTAPIIKDRKTGAQSMLVSVASRRRLPLHAHRGAEMTCVLQGNFSDVSGTYGPGDFLEMDVANEHQPVTGDVDCICVIANTAPPRFRNILGWFVQAYS